MGDVFWAAIISATTAITVTLLTQWLSLRIANQQAVHQESIERLKWEQSESSRKEEVLREQTRYQEEIAREDARRREEIQAQRLQTYWTHVLDSNMRMKKLLEQVSERVRNLPSEHPIEEQRISGHAVELPSFAAANGYAVTLLGFTQLYRLTREYYQATVSLELAAQMFDLTRMETEARVWTKAFVLLETEVAKITGALFSPMPHQA